MRISKRVRRIIRPLLRGSGTILGLLIRLWCRTLKVRLEDPNGFFEASKKDPQANIYVIWHNRLLFLVPLVPAHIRRNTAFLASRSEDGDIITAIFESFGMTPIRGSTNRQGRDKGGVRALIQMRRRINEGFSIGLTPDGPRGPLYHVHDGAVWLALKSGAAVIPVGLEVQSCWRLKSWDRTILPKPFSLVRVIVGDAVRVDAGENADFEEVRERIRRGLLAITGDHSQE
ncbi:MAG: DUF374 domain-containing protein [Lentisphaerae bacterium]|nr:MAG: DUF374 domain-containing protein [Lentisphaerota bacterium]